MLQAIRTRAGGIIVKVLFGLLILSFGFWGIYTRSPFFQDEKSPDAVVASVGERDISAGQLQTAVQPALERLRAQFGGSLDLAQAKQLGLPETVLNQLIEQSLLDQEVRRLRLDLSDDVVRTAIMANPSFVGPDGQFNRNQFNQVLAMNHLTEDALVARLRGQIPRGDLLQALTAGAELPAPIIDTLYRYRTETRIADLVTIPLTAAAGVGAPSDSDIQKFYDDHPDMFKSPEYRGFLLASLSIGDVAGDIHITDEQVKSAYDERKDELAIPEQRQIEQILAPSEDKAKAAEAALAAGQDFKDVATKIAGQDPQTIDLGLVKIADLPKPIADAAFDLPLDQASPPVHDSFGWHILRVVKIEPPTTPSLEDARKQLVDELTQDAEADRLDHVANGIDDALAGGASLADVAGKYDLKTMTVTASDVGGRDPDGKPVTLPVSTKDVLKTVFETDQQQTSRVNAIEDGAIYAVHVDKVTPAATRPLADVRDQVVAAWTAEQKVQAVKAEADAIAAAATGGTTLAFAAADKKLGITTTPPLSRRPQQDAAVPPALAAKLFAAKVGDIVTGSDAAGAYVAQLKAIQVPDKTPADAVTALKDELGNSQRYDMVGALTEALKKRYAVTVHHDVLDKMF